MATTQSVPEPPSVTGWYFAQLDKEITGGDVTYVVGVWHVVLLNAAFPRKFYIAGYAEAFHATRVKRWGKLIPIPEADAPRSPTGLPFPGF